MTAPTPHDLLALALGHLPPEERERLEHALRDDPESRRRYAALRKHLARWEALAGAAPPPPPFAAVAARLPARPQRTWGWRPVAVGVGVVAVLALAVVLAGGLDRGESDVVGRAHWGLDVAGTRVEAGGRRAVRAGESVRADGPASLALERANVMLDAGAELVVLTPTAVHLRAGRAWFSVGPGPFRVETSHGPVDVRGTRFEVAVAPDGLRVEVEAGRVEANGHPLEAGELLLGGSMRPASGPHVAWWTRPRLRVTPIAAAQVGAPVRLVFTLDNHAYHAVRVPHPDGVRTALWLEVTDPDGVVHDLAVSPDAFPAVDEAADASDTSLRLPPRRSSALEAVFTTPFVKRGSYRCRALYRPDGAPPLLSDTLLLEVR